MGPELLGDGNLGVVLSSPPSVEFGGNKRFTSLLSCFGSAALLRSLGGEHVLAVLRADETPESDSTESFLTSLLS